eukprot:GFUD01139878.1.p1 GENE.GFUD01139878.1~~GFUD01139878.1.p1  ORF type:complete len:275 (-),score=45.94 GFUD01139878.1:293-1117(-)
MSDYEIKRSLGSGSFGEVFLAKKGGQCYAIKKVKNTDPTAKQEVKILRSVSHKNIIKYFGNFWERGMMCIVLEYADKGTFEKKVLGNLDREEYNVWRTLSHLSGALKYLHAQRPKQILHRDLKPDNILGVNVWSKEEQAHRISWKLADFGVAKLLNRDAQEAYYGAEYEGVPTYMAPEVYDDYERYSAASDVWSLGCVIAFYINKGRHVFYTPEDVQSFAGEEHIVDDDSYGEYSQDLLQLVFSMLSPDEDERPTAHYVYQETQLYDRREDGRH